MLTQNILTPSHLQQSTINADIAQNLEKATKMKNGEYGDDTNPIKAINRKLRGKTAFD